eukprot:COSAG01_NODE_822_length_13306_cov_4.866132_12_plen_181_part_00
MAAGGDHRHGRCSSVEGQAGHRRLRHHRRHARDHQTLGYPTPCEQRRLSSHRVNGSGRHNWAVPSGAGKPASSQPAEEAATKPAPPARRGSKRRAAAPQSAPARPKKQKVASRVPDLFCTCQQKADPNRDWIGCRQCLGWCAHGRQPASVPACGHSLASAMHGRGEGGGACPPGEGTRHT